jgi:uncharacterized membrane protein
VRDRVVWLLTVTYAVLFTFLGAVRYADHRNFVDFGIFAQTAVNAFGCFCNPIEGSHWAFHFSPILYFVGAVVWLWRSPLALITMQACACALTIPPIAGLVERRADVPFARLAGVIVFLYPALAGLTFVDFHENGFAPASVAWMLWAFDGGYNAAALIFALITLSIKEDQSIFLAIAGLVGARRFRGTSAGRTALAVAIIAIAVGAVFFWYIRPSAAATAHWSPSRFYAWTPADLRALFPLGIAQRLGFIVLAFAPLAFLPFCSRMMWLAAAPLAEVLLSRMSTTFTLSSHYAGAWIGYVLVAFAFALRSLPSPASMRRAAQWCTALCVVEFLVADPLHPGLNLHVPEQRDAALSSVLRDFPPDASIATQEEAYTHLALADPYARLLPENADEDEDACFVLIDRAYPDSPRLREYGAALDRLVRAGIYVPVLRNDGIELYRRSSSCQ